MDDTQLKNFLEMELRTAQSNYILHSSNYSRCMMGIPPAGVWDSVEELRDRAGDHFNNVLWFTMKAWMYR